MKLREASAGKRLCAAFAWSMIEVKRYFEFALMGIGTTRSRLRARTDALVVSGWFRPRGPAAGAPGLLAWLAAQVAQEIDARRLFVWLPAGMVLGIILYFAADREPFWWAPWMGLMIAGGFAIVNRARLFRLAVLMAIASVFAGFGFASLRTQSAAAPVLDGLMIGALTGFIERIDYRREGAARMVLRPTAVEGVPAAQLPVRIRLTTREGAAFAAGDHVSLKARIMPPPTPARPGGYDFSRDAYFSRIGAVGSVLGGIRKVAAPDGPGLWIRTSMLVDRARNAVTQRILAAIGGEAGAVAAALVAGKRDAISGETNQELRAAGIYHVVSISGLHMVLAAGMVFWLTRAVLALCPVIGRTWPVKKIAALTAMAGAVAYDIFAGSEVATERSLVMTLVMFGAVLAGRQAMSMRNLAVAAMIIMAIEPETVLGPSFQMSFAAVAALVAFFEKRKLPVPASAVAEAALAAPAARPAAAFEPPVIRVLKRGLWWAAGVLITTIVAEGATSAYAAYHFQRTNFYGLIGNALTLPIVELVVMPAALAGMLAYPFGLDSYVWAAMGYGVELMLKLARWVAGLPGSTNYIMAFGPGAIVLFSFALLWATLWQGLALRLMAIPVFAASLGLAAATQRPDIFVAPDGEALAARNHEAALTIVSRRGNPFTIEQWLSAQGDTRKPKDPALAAGATCDPLGCVLRLADGRILAFVKEPAAFPEDCARADIIVSPLTAPRACKAATILDQPSLARTGALAITFEGRRMTIVSTRPAGIERPWIRARRGAGQADDLSPAASGGAGLVRREAETMGDKPPHVD